MKITTKMYYQEAYIPPQCRKERYREAVKTIATTVPEAHYEDAPVALRRQDCLRADAADADGKYPSGITSPMQTSGSNEMWVDYRLYRGRLYCRAMMYHFCAGGRGPYTMEEFVKHYAQSPHYSVMLNFKEASEGIRSSLHKYLILDGDIWLQCREPVYCIVTFGLGHNHAETVLMTEGYKRGVTKQTFFNALQREEAIEACKQVALDRGDTNSISSIGGFWKIEVLIPEAVKAPRKEANRAKKAVKRAPQDLLPCPLCGKDLRILAPVRKGSPYTFSCSCGFQFTSKLDVQYQEAVILANRRATPGNNIKEEKANVE